MLPLSYRHQIPEITFKQPQNCIEFHSKTFDELVLARFTLHSASTPSLSTSYSQSHLGYLIFRLASRLDAFSVYPLQTYLLSYALGKTTDST